MAELALGKKTTALYEDSKALHAQLDRYAYGPPPVRLGATELDQARAGAALLDQLATVKPGGMEAAALLRPMQTSA